jgi:farnesyl-diphosphate farnesyltransferase
LEKKSVAAEVHLSDQMGLFLQKTNIIRDYLEDYVDKRALPFGRRVSGRSCYSATGDLGYFTNQSDPQVQEKPLQCLNELVTDALELVPDCLVYLSKLECVEIFRFCAIPRVMAIATLDKVYANPDVFTGVVKIHKGLYCKLILHTNNPTEEHEIFYNCSKSIQSQLLKRRNQGFVDPSFARTLRVCETIQKLTKQAAVRPNRTRSMRFTVCVGLTIASALLYYLHGFDENWDAQDHCIVRAALVVAASILYLYGPWTVQSNLTKANILRAKRRICNE